MHAEKLAEYIASHPQEWCLLLDVDGTLLEIADQPEHVHVPPFLPTLLNQLGHHLEGALALISGRTLSSLCTLFPDLSFPLIGQHGGESTLPDWRPAIAADKLHALAMMERAAEALTRQFSQLRNEKKGVSLSLHYRQAPQYEQPLRAQLKKLHAPYAGALTLTEGKYVFEMQPLEVSKEQTIKQLMTREPFQRRRPIFAGDDKADLAAFAVIKAFNGQAIWIGPESNGDIMFDQPGTFLQWLRFVEETLQARHDPDRSYL